MQKVSWFLKFSAAASLALIVAVAALGTGSGASAHSAAAATPAATAAATVAAPPSFPLCYPTAQIAKVRIAHASPNTPAVDIYLDGAAKPTYAKVVYGTATDYTELGAGKHHAKIAAAGTDPSVAANVVWDKDFTIAGNTAYTLVAQGTTADATFRVQPYIDDVSDTAGTIRIVVLHLVPDDPSVDILVSGTPVATGVTFGNSVELNITLSSTDHAQVTKAGNPSTLILDGASPNQADIQIVKSGTQTVLFDLPKTPMKPDTIYTILATGLVGTNVKITPADKPVALKAVVLTSASFKGFQPPPTSTPTPVAAATTAATPAATVAAPVATAAVPVATAAVPVATAPAATAIPAGNLANAGWVLRTSKARQLNAPTALCVEVAAISIVGGPAASAGINAGDYILGINGKPLAKATDFEAIIAAHKSGDKLQVTFQSKGTTTEQTVTLVLGANPFSS